MTTKIKVTIMEHNGNNITIKEFDTEPEMIAFISDESGFPPDNVREEIDSTGSFDSEEYSYVPENDGDEEDNEPS